VTAGPRVTASDVVVLTQGTSAREFDGDWVLLDFRGGNYFGLDELGGLIWQYLSTGKSPAQIAQMLGQNYDVSEQVLLQDVLEFVNELAVRGLVELEKT